MFLAAENIRKTTNEAGGGAGGVEGVKRLKGNRIHRLS